MMCHSCYDADNGIRAIDGDRLRWAGRPGKERHMKPEKDCLYGICSAKNLALFGINRLALSPAITIIITKKMLL